METFIIICKIWLWIGFFLSTIYHIFLILIKPRTFMFFVKTESWRFALKTLLIYCITIILGPLFILIIGALWNDMMEGIREGDYGSLRKAMIKEEQRKEDERRLVINWNECDNCENCENCDHTH